MPDGRDPTGGEVLEDTSALHEELVDKNQIDAALRWRLVLGKFSDDRLALDRFEDQAKDDMATLLDESERMDRSLSYIYDREQDARSERTGDEAGSPSLSIPNWLGGVRDLFPQEAQDVIQQDALLRYGMTELVTDAAILKKAEPNEALMKAILQFKHLMEGEVLEAAKEVVRQVVRQMSADLMKECGPALHGVVDPDNRPPARTFKNTDWKRTIGRNLKHFDQARDTIVAERIFFKHKTRYKASRWRIIVAVDQSGSMLDSLIHSSIMAAIFCSLPSVDVRLVLWDDRVVDVSEHAADPLSVLMGTQLGGGTKMWPAMQHCGTLIEEPERTIFVLVSDWYIFGEQEKCLALAQELVEAGVTCIGLNALDRDAKPVFDENFAKQLAGCGWFVASLTPKRLAEHIAKLIA
jgi:hypothetical protein